MTVTLARVYDHGWRIALVGDAARKYTPVVVMQAAGLRLVKKPNSQARHFQPVPGYPIRRAVRSVSPASPGQ